MSPFSPASMITGAHVDTAAPSKEFQLLCACAGIELSSERAALIARLNRSEIVWSELLRLAEHHGVLPLLARNLKAHATSVPNDIEMALRSAYEANLRRSLWFAGELLRITSRFEETGLLAIPYKGPVLAELSYGDVALRSFSDLDFLISPASFAAAKHALADLGYQASYSHTPVVERFWLRKGYECSFDGAAGKYLVELQWALLPYFYAVDFRVDDLLQRGTLQRFGGTEISALAPEDSLIVLCLHAAKHLWMRLIWVCDIAETIRTQTLDWNVVVSRARELGIARIVGVSFSLIDHLLGAPLPGVAKQLMDADSSVHALGKIFAERLARSAVYDFDSPDYFRWILRLRERRWDQSRYLQRLITTPGQGDLEAVKLPERLFPMYRAVRMARLLRWAF